MLTQQAPPSQTRQVHTCTLIQYSVRMSDVRECMDTAATIGENWVQMSLSEPLVPAFTIVCILLTLVPMKHSTEEHLYKDTSELRTPP